MKFAMDIAVVSLEDQGRQILQKSLECYTLVHQEEEGVAVGCPRVWDGVLCWPPTPRDTVATLPCPDYVNGFSVAVNATRSCTNTGEWWVNPELNTTWTNLSLCTAAPDTGDRYHIPEIIAAHMDRIRLMYNVGYGISLFSLVLALGVIIYFRRLHCPRNIIHANLFVSFVLRSVISFVKENALVNGVGFPADVLVTEDGAVEFLDNGSHWCCKLFFTIFNYILCANYMWIFVEGVYLHMLITVVRFSERSGVRRLMVLGWVVPVLIVIPWAVVRATLEDELCWNTHPTPGYFWMIRGPICAAMIINFIIFLNIIRVLFTKLNAFKTPEPKRYRYRKLAKSTLILIPLFGVHYIVFIGLPDRVDQTTELVKLYYEMFFNSFQGFLVSLLFCFLNGEVQTEFKKKWRRILLTRQGSDFKRKPRDTMTTFVSRARESVVSSNYLGRDLVNGNPQFPLGNGEKRVFVDTSFSARKSDSNGHARAHDYEFESQPLTFNTTAVSCESTGI